MHKKCHAINVTAILLYAISTMSVSFNTGLICISFKGQSWRSYAPRKLINPCHTSSRTASGDHAHDPHGNKTSNVTLTPHVTGSFNLAPLSGERGTSSSGWWMDAGLESNPPFELLASTWSTHGHRTTPSSRYLSRISLQHGTKKNTRTKKPGIVRMHGKTNRQKHTRVELSDKVCPNTTQPVVREEHR